MPTARRLASTGLLSALGAVTAAATADAVDDTLVYRAVTSRPAHLATHSPRRRVRPGPPHPPGPVVEVRPGRSAAHAHRARHV